MRVSRIRGIAQIEEDILRIQLLFHYYFKIFLNSERTYLLEEFLDSDRHSFRIQTDDYFMLQIILKK